MVYNSEDDIKQGVFINLEPDIIKIANQISEVDGFENISEYVQDLILADFDNFQKRNLSLVSRTLNSLVGELGKIAEKYSLS